MTATDGGTDYFYGHPIGVDSLNDIEAFLNNHRKPSPTTDAYLMDNAYRLRTMDLMEMLLTP